MDPKHRNIIKENETRLIELIKFENLEPHLVPFNIFTQEMVDDLKSLTDLERRTMLIQDLPTRGPEAFQKFGEILLNTDQAEAAQLLGFSRVVGKIFSAHQLTRAEVPYPNGLRRDSNSNVSSTFQGNIEVFRGPEFYRMLSSPRGQCLLINNRYFSKTSRFTDRDGTQVDGENIKKVFRELDFLIDEHNNLTKDEMYKELQRFSSLDTHKKYDAAVVFMLSHGERDCVVGVDGEQLSVKKIVRLFDSLNAPTLQGKPKLFFIQACRGDCVDYGVPTLTTDASTYSPARVPILTDILVSHSCNEDFVAYRDTERGSWYIISLLEAITEKAHFKSLNDILLDMEERIRSFSGPQGEMTSTETKYIGFNKRLYFNPGYSE